MKVSFESLVVQWCPHLICGVEVLPLSGWVSVWLDGLLIHHPVQSMAYAGEWIAYGANSVPKMI